MTTDWSDRTAALDYFSKLLKQAKRFNDDEKDLYEAAVHALRRSQDHTAIQNKLNEFKASLAQAEAAARINAETIAEQQKEIGKLKSLREEDSRVIADFVGKIAEQRREIERLESELRLARACNELIAEAKAK